MGHNVFRSVSFMKLEKTLAILHWCLYLLDNTKGFLSTRRGSSGTHQANLGEGGRAQQYTSGALVGFTSTRHPPAHVWITTSCAITRRGSRLLLGITVQIVFPARRIARVVEMRSLNASKGLRLNTTARSPSQSVCCVLPCNMSPIVRCALCKISGSSVALLALQGALQPSAPAAFGPACGDRCGAKGGS